MANYRLREKALLDLERIWFYGLEHWGAEAANRYQDAFFDHFEELAAEPFMFPIVDIKKGYRRSICGKDNVYYRLENDVVEIAAILGRQDAGAWL